MSDSAGEGLRPLADPVKKRKGSKKPADASSDPKRGRNEAGHFLPGHSLGGRPRRPDLLTLVANSGADRAQLESDVREVWACAVALAKTGDIHAIKLVLDRATDPDALKLEGGLSLQVVTGIPPREP